VATTILVCSGKHRFDWRIGIGAVTSLGTWTDVDNQLEYIGGYFYPAGTSVTSGAITVEGVTHVGGVPIFGDLLESIPPGILGDDVEAQVSQLSENQTGPVLHFDSISAHSASASNDQTHAERLRHAVQVCPNRCSQTAPTPILTP
jgi:hypothetical protein